MRIGLNPVVARLVLALTPSLLLLSAVPAFAAMTVTLHAHHLEALTNSDVYGEQDMYWRVHMSATNASAAPVDCDTLNHHLDDRNSVKVDWACTLTLSGVSPATMMQIHVSVFDEDTVGDDELGISPVQGQLGLDLTFDPNTSKLTINGDTVWPANSCAVGHIKKSGFGGGSEEPAAIEFSITSSRAGAPEGDSDGDGLLDSWETCGIGGDGSATVLVDLPKMGAKVFRMDVFTEIDWLQDTTHSHAPWLPALAIAWNEMNAAPIANVPSPDGTSLRGIALHMDTGRLYAGGYKYDSHGDGTAILETDADGNKDFDGDTIPDLGDLGHLGTGTHTGGKEINETGFQIMQPAPPAPGGVLLGGGTELFDEGSSFAKLKANNFQAVRDVAFHYVIFGHQIAGTDGATAGLPVGNSGISAGKDLMVTLATFGQQRFDADRDGFPDPLPIAGPLRPPPRSTLIFGPGGLRVRGFVSEHAGTFLHELGHALTLDHGGVDELNFKPNYLSIMNYSFQTSGISFDTDADGFPNQVTVDGSTVDFDGDGILDRRRFQYMDASVLGLPPELNELNLNENNATWTGSFALTNFACPAPPGTPPGKRPNKRTIAAGQPVDWNCNATPGETGRIADINGGISFDPSLAVNDDYQTLLNGGLAKNFPQPGVSVEERDDNDARTLRIFELSQREPPFDSCIAPRRLNFDTLPAGTVVDRQFAKAVLFDKTPGVTPAIEGPADRFGAPTSSQSQSLVNRASGPALLKLTFVVPQRVISFRFGQIGITDQLLPTSRLAINAFDDNGLPMGVVVKNTPPQANGVTARTIVAAIYGYQKIRRLEIGYEMKSPFAALPWQLAAVPVHIDDLEFCSLIKETEPVRVAPTRPPVWGTHTRNLNVQTVVYSRVAGTGEPGLLVTKEIPVTGIPIRANGQTKATNAVFSALEGSVLKLSAPAKLSGRYPFLEWRYKGVSFGQGVRDIPFTLLRDGTVTAVYLARDYRGHER